MNQPKRRLGLSLCVLIGCVVLAIVATALHRASLSGTVSLSLPDSQQISKATPRHIDFSSLPVAFEPNLGQTDPQVKYLARGSGYTLFLTSSEAVLSLAPQPVPASKHQANNRFAKSPMMSRKSHASGTSVAVIRMQVAGGNQQA